MEIDLGEEPETLFFKVLVVGESSVGKTSFIHRYVNGTFQDNYKATIGVQFYTKEIHWNDEFNVRLQIWDLAGQEKLGTQTRIFFKETDGMICLYDVTDEASKAQVAHWKKHVDDHVYKQYCIDGNPKNREDRNYHPPSLMLANKIDLIEEKDFNVEEMIARAEQLQFVNSYAVSVSDDLGIDKSMNELISIMINNYIEYNQNNGDIKREDEEIVNLESDQKGLVERGKSYCCGDGINPLL